MQYFLVLVYLTLFAVALLSVELAVRLITLREVEKAKTVVMLFLVGLAFFLLVSLASAQTWHEMDEVRPGYTTGFGYVIDDLERHSDGKHPMRNEKDPGNWAHELIHQLHSDLRLETPEVDNCFYFGKGAYVRLTEPRVTLRQVAALVPKDKRGASYNTYLKHQQRWWNNEPLYVLDEAVANATGLHYHVTTNTKDAKRLDMAQEFLAYTQALEQAVKKHDPNYAQLDQLEAVVKFHANWVASLVAEYNGEKVEPVVEPTDYDLT